MADHNPAATVLRSMALKAPSCWPWLNGALFHSSLKTFKDLKARPCERCPAGGWRRWDPDPPQGEREDVLREQATRLCPSLHSKSCLRFFCTHLCAEGQGRTHWFEIQIDVHCSKRIQKTILARLFDDIPLCSKIHKRGATQQPIRLN